jgi:cytochrome c553
MINSKPGWLKQPARPLSILFSVILALVAIPLAAIYELTEDEEINQALLLKPDLESGKRIFTICVQCHTNGAQGSRDGTFPQLAGQHRSVIIKQIADIRFGNRDNPLMVPFAQSAIFGNPQGLSDVAGYISALPTNTTPGLGDGADLERGAKLFKENCATCHNDNGMGDDELLFPRIQGQHYAYLLRQLNWIREGKRRNVYRGMVNKLRHMEVADFKAVADYISRLPVPTGKAPAKPKFEDDL